MKTKHLLATAACMAAMAMAATSCNNDELPDNNNPGNQTATDNATFTITASTPAEKPTTRLEYKEGTAEAPLEVKWAKGEEAFVAQNMPNTGWGKGIKAIKAKTTESSKTATFAVHDIIDGDLTKLEAGTLYALYPAKGSYNEAFGSTLQDILLPLTRQSGKLDDMHDFDYMTALAYINDPNEIPNLSFKHRVAILRLSGLTFQDATGGDATTISISGTGLKTEGELILIGDANTTTLKPAGDDGTITTTGTFAIGSDGKLKENVYICFFPPTGGISNLKITATVGDNSYEYSYAGTVGTASNPFEEGYMYTLSDAEMMKSKIVYDYTLEQQKSVKVSKPDLLANPGQENSESNPYLITTKEELQWVKMNPAETYSYKLMKDVEIVDQGGAANWIPIGNIALSSPQDIFKDAFKGHFDGNNMKIIGKIVADKDMSTFGFFGAGDGAKIKNLHMEADIIDVSAITAHAPVIGGIIGFVNNGNIEHCTNNAAVFSQNNNIHMIGGIAGGCDMGSKITACLNTGNIDISALAVGGISGAINKSTIIGCINKGTIKTNYQDAATAAGGIVGVTEGTVEVTACWNYATEIINENGSMAGAIVGGDQSSNNFTDCYWKKKVGLEGIGYGSMDSQSTGTFDGDAPTPDQIATMNAKWKTVDSGSKYQFNSTTGEIEPKQ